MVLYPFMGSGTTNFVAQRMYRNSIGIELYKDYFDLVKEKIEPTKLVLFEPEQKYESTKIN
jgi:DNA modification methylase